MTEHYDVTILKRYNIKLDRLINYVYIQNEYVKKYFVPNSMYPFLNNITMPLVREFKKLAHAHIKYIKENINEYGILYKLIDECHFNAIELDYKNFPLMTNRSEIIATIEEMAKHYYEENLQKFDATCLYLLYFYALLVNPIANWLMIDYLNQGNKYHQYYIMLNTCRSKILY